MSHSPLQPLSMCRGFSRPGHFSASYTVANYTIN
jgi:hypothetical protein